MATTTQTTDLLLEGVQQNIPQRLVDAPKFESRGAPERGFDWKPTLLVVAVLAAAVLAFSYL